MSNKKKILLTFDLEQVCNDVLAKCNLVSMSIRDVALEDIKANVQEPDNPETRSIICRAVTEAFGKVKVACQRYLTVGRTTDSNTLERLVKGFTYGTETIQVQEEDEKGRLLYTYNGDTVYKVDSQWYNASSGDEVTIAEGQTPEKKMVSKVVETDEIDSMEYETITLQLEIPNFNTAVTDHLKSAIHKYVVDYVMGRFLQDQVSDKAGEYKQLADGEDYAAIISDLNARERYTMRKPSWT